jgi:enoyl-CoA hydratase/carnithine racemase
VISITDHDGARVLTFDRPEVLNAFNVAMYEASIDALRSALADDRVGAVVLTGAGRAFSSGADLVELAAIAQGNGPPGSDGAFATLIEVLADFDKPLLAAVNGVGVGLGFTILAYCDVVYIDGSARLKAPFVELGVPPEAASTYLFPARVGWQHAARILLTAEWVSAPEAVAIGIATEVCADGTALDHAIATAQRIATGAPGAVRATKRLLLAAQRDAVMAARAREDAEFARTFAEGWTRP